MTSQAVATPQSTAWPERYRHPKQAVRDRYGFARSERFVDIDEPAARIRVVEVWSGSRVLMVHMVRLDEPAGADRTMEVFSS